MVVQCCHVSALVVNKGGNAVRNGISQKVRRSLNLHQWLLRLEVENRDVPVSELDHKKFCLEVHLHSQQAAVSARIVVELLNYQVFLPVFKPGHVLRLANIKKVLRF